LNGTLLNVTTHDRDSAALHYVYPVVSRRAGGVSVGVNLNPNNACNWRCVYCQVPNLTRGSAPKINLTVLQRELRSFLTQLLHGGFMESRVPEGSRQLHDIAISGNGEPTSSAQFGEVIDLIGQTRSELALPSQVKTILITNGSLLYRESVQEGLRKMASLNGEVWFKLDRASERGMLLVNDVHMKMAQVHDNLAAAMSCCPTWLQTCWFAFDGVAPSQQDEDDYLDFVSALLHAGHKPQGVLLYTIARPAMQPEAPRVSALSEQQLDAFSDRIGRLGLAVRVSS
jgi:wyosine [tRNA(Phe)-imidazoG37] synthetase (radical SAM superfamily)